MTNITLRSIEIFNVKSFNNQLESKPDQLLSLLKETIQSGQEAIKQAFEAGASTLEIVHTRASFIDQILIQAFNVHFSDCNQSVALIAVGGYGRGELHPASDIDLMLLLKEKESPETKEKLEQFLMLLWDSKLDIGHSVRTLTECIDEATKDITVVTNLMESRLLTGDESLFNDMVDATGPDKIWNSKDFFKAKLDEQTQRHRKFGDTAYNLEPNIKENPGGLRDLQMIGWVAKRHFGTRISHELADHSFLSQTELSTLNECQTYLWKIRIHLHYLTGKHEDRMLFDLQRQLASDFGYEDGDNNLAIEQFMQKYYRTVLELERLNELLLQLFRQEILYTDEQEEPVVINLRFHVINDYIAARNEDIFIDHPSSLLEIFLIMELHPEIRGVHAQTIRLIREHKHLIDEKFRASQTAKQLFIDIITQTRGVTHELRRMNRYGILAAYIPAFNQIVGRMQYDLFHAYTVDQHTLFVVRNMRRLSVPNFAHEQPLASGIFHHLEKPELLYLAGLFHDIAKGRGGNHAELGAVDAEEFCLNHGQSEEDSKFVGWLVKKHLLMSMVAQRKDISDPEVIFAFANEMGSLAHLDNLYLLTMCDIRATNPKQWNSWKANLLAELYHKAAAAIKAGLDNPIRREFVSQETRTSATRLLAKLGVVSEELNELWTPFPDDYFINHTPYEVSWHSQILLDPEQSLPKIKSRITSRGEAEIFIYSEENDKSFAIIASTLEQLGLNIADAKINITDDNFAINSFKVLEDNGSSPTEQYRMVEITDKLMSRLTNPDDIINPSNRLPSRTQKNFSVETKIRFDQLVGNDITVLNIVASDRHGLLANIAKAFAECEIHIHHAKIATAGEKALDNFYITDKNHNPLLDDQSLEKLKSTLLKYLN
ncbi:MAG: [protein-PII] uridylyltransferase [endosymbiont of Galathealinum brachiosum]|uniref:Bifunctional uridylyltransferase/uridylyl-removing enzyme n=1 Tax=endosymbiont of Galathealinum brachiosum TaxID=2200906 RepID=A0A370DK19_9GAMM|nr:MAG: [protein-PII] uridylyltransferase [endosymbiont of Galathealinum brachiosum]